MHALHRLGITLGLATTLAAGCGGNDLPPDQDVGPTIDSGPGHDAATTRDTGAPMVDTGVPPADTGIPPTDTGVPPADTGTDAFAATPDTGSSGGCGGGPACVAPFTCSASGYCASASGVPAFDHVYAVVFENRSLTSVAGHAPYFDMLTTMGASASNYVSVAHPSLPNYIAMTSGNIWGDSCDCHPGTSDSCSATTCSILGGFCSCEHDVMHLGDQLDAASITWREYGEGMGTPCNSTDASATHYAVRHLPFMYYTNVLSNMARCTAHVRDYADFAADMGSYRFTMISPNLCNDMHDTCGGNAVTHGDTWASTNLGRILAQPGFAAGGHDVLFVVFDEEDGSRGNAPIPFIVVSPLAHAGHVTTAAYNHYSLLATWEDSMGLPRLSMAVGAPAISDIWR